MSKYINTNDLELEVSHYLQCEKESEAITLEELKEITNRLPPADCAKVVRCKDCKYREKSSHSNRRDFCKKHTTWEYTDYVNPTDYCSKGERKEIDG